MSNSNQTSAPGDSPRGPSGPSGWDIVKQAMITSGTFVVVSAIAGPVAGAIAATLVGSGNDDPSGGAPLS